MINSRPNYILFLKMSTKMSKQLWNLPIFALAIKKRKSRGIDRRLTSFFVLEIFNSCNMLQ